MRKTFDDLPNWTFDLDEVSAGVYKVVGSHLQGCSLEAKGIDPNDLMERAINDARRMVSDMERMRNS